MNILDTTIRDGSYAVDFKFSTGDVRDLVRRSERIGMHYIEIGHGLGLNASSAENGWALHTDDEYMDAARETTKNAKLGLFCIPGIARMEDIENARAHGMDFLRVGINVNEYTKAAPYVRKAHDEGFWVTVNYMKSYAVGPKEFAGYAAAAADYGADCVYIVDSAGCMTPEEIGRYIDATRSKSSVQLGFHGHNNLGLAVENTVYCVKQGVDFVDCSFQGLGRSVGNASIEQVVMLLSKLGLVDGFDIPRVLEYGYAGLRHIVSVDRMTNPLDYMCGYAGFHSSFLKYIYRCSTSKQVDPLRLILAYSQINRTTMDYERLSEVADSLKKDPDDNPYHFGKYFTEQYND